MWINCVALKAYVCQMRQLKHPVNGFNTSSTIWGGQMLHLIHTFVLIKLSLFFVHQPIQFSLF